METWRKKRLNYLPKVTQLVSGRPGFELLTILLPFFYGAPCGYRGRLD